MSLKYIFLHCNFSLTVVAPLLASPLLCFRYMSPPTLFPHSSAPFSLPPLLFFCDAQLLYYIPFPSHHFILVALLPLYLIYISSPISILAPQCLLFSLSFPSFSISSFPLLFLCVFSKSESSSTGKWSASCLGDT